MFQPHACGNSKDTGLADLHDRTVACAIDTALGTSIEILVFARLYFLGVTPIARCHSPEVSQPAAALRMRSDLASIDARASSGVNFGGFQR